MSDFEEDAGVVAAGRDGLDDFDDDDFDEFDDNEEEEDVQLDGQDDERKKITSKLVQNQHHDETIEWSNDDSSPPPSRSAAPSSNTDLGRTQQMMSRVPEGEFGRSNAPLDTPTGEIHKHIEHEEEDDDDDDDEDGGKSAGLGESPERELEQPIVKNYDPLEFDSLKVSSEVRELFAYIGRHTLPPENAMNEIRPVLAPFIPDYVPSVGDIDPFVKVPRPDAKPEDLGLVVLDEPNAVDQSDPAILEMQLRATSKQNVRAPITVLAINEARRNPKQVDEWIRKVADIHRSKPPPNVIYSKMMPDVDELMQLWPSTFEAAIEPSSPIIMASLQLELEQFARIACNLVDIPVYEGASQLRHSLHLFFTLYHELVETSANTHIASANSG